jgi:hypothetical protein
MFDRFKQTVNQAAGTAKWKADQLVRINKVQGEINTLKHQVGVARDQIAAAVLDMRARGEALPPELESMCAAVDAAQAQVAEHEAQLAAINAEAAPGAQPVPGAVPVAPVAPAAATKECPNCHAHVPAAAGFCTTCGYSFAAAPAPAPAAEKTTQTCPHCNFEAPLNSAFCPNCGQRIVPA